jgi:hypothetical protein
MKSISNLLKMALLGCFAFSGITLYAQPEFKSDVQKEFDEHGNIIRYDSCWSWSYHGGPDIDLDSLFNQLYEKPPFAFDFYWDSASSFFDHSPDFERFFHFADSMRMLSPHLGFPHHHWFHHPGTYFDSIFSSPFPDPYFHGDLFRDFFEDDPFPDLDRLFEDHMEMMQQFFHRYPHPGDSIRYHQPGWRYSPGHQKKSVHTIEI